MIIKLRKRFFFFFFLKRERKKERDILIAERFRQLINIVFRVTLEKNAKCV